MPSLGLLYVGLWAAFGATCGFLVCYGLNAQKKGPPYHNAWAMYAAGMVFSLGLLAGIHEIDCVQLLNNSYCWAGIAAMAIGFFVPLWKRSKRSK